MSEAEKIERTPANDNPWYWLATVYGEQIERQRKTIAYDFHWGLHEKNRTAWNRWLAGELSEESKRALIALGIDALQLEPFAENERYQFLESFARRTGGRATSPPPSLLGVDFRRTKFELPASFAGFVFPVNTIFEDSIFEEEINFQEAVFFGSVNLFSRAEFYRRANFWSAIFSGSVAFNDVNFAGGADFELVKCSDQVIFLRARFESVTNFNGARFSKTVPLFHDAEMAEAITWHSVVWPTAPTDKVDARFQVIAYEKLKAEMERLKKHSDEQFFYAKELRARRALETPLSFKWLLYFAYENLGGYGQNAALPLMWLAFLWAVGASLFARLPTKQGYPLDYEVAARLSLNNVAPVLPFKPGEEITKQLEAWAKWFGILQSVTGAVLLFLFGLALRNLFRMK